MWRRKRLASLVFPVLLLIAAASCGDDGGSEVVVVSAASSLTEAFTELADSFESANPGVEVVLNFAGSAALREQILGGAEVDVFVSADHANMDPVAHLAAVAPSVVARNDLVLAVPAGNPSEVSSLDALADPDRFVGLCAEPVPCGALSARLLDAAGVAARPDTLEPNVRSLLAKLEAAELDVGLVYRSDVLANDDVERVAHPFEGRFLTEYPIVWLHGAPSAALEFVEFVASPAGAEILGRYGFSPP